MLIIQSCKILEVKSQLNKKHLEKNKEDSSQTAYYKCFMNNVKRETSRKKGGFKVVT